MRAILALLALAACGTEAPPPAPEPAPAPVEAPPPAPPAPVDEINKDRDISAMADADKQAFLMKLGEKVYKTGDGGTPCITCHMEAGTGTPGAFPPLVGQKDLMGDCKKHAGYVINGLSGAITVNGQAYNGVMPPQGAMLNDLQIAAVISYERNSWGNNYGYCMPEDVKAAR